MLYSYHDCPGTDIFAQQMHKLDLRKARSIDVVNGGEDGHFLIVPQSSNDSHPGYLIVVDSKESALAWVSGLNAARAWQPSPAAAPVGGGDAAAAAQPGGFVAFLAGLGKFASDVISVLIVVFLITFVLMLVIKAVRESFVFVCGIGVLAPILGAIRAAVDAVVASPPFKLVLCVLYAFGPEDIKASSPGNVALREELAKDGSSVEAIETTIIVMRCMCMCWGVAEIALSLIGVTLLLKVCRYFIPVEY